MQISKARAGISSGTTTRMGETYCSPLLSSSHLLSSSVRPTDMVGISASRPYSPAQSSDKNAYKLMRENHELTMKNLDLQKQLQKVNIKFQVSQ